MMKHHHQHISTLVLFAGLLTAGFGMPQTLSAETTEVQQQQRATGVVVDEGGVPVLGATVSVVGTKQVTVTNDSGRFSFNGLKNGTQLRVSYIGYKPQVVRWEGSELRIQLEEDNMLNEAVVTAMGIVRKEKSLTYATQQIKGEDLMKVQDPNIANSIEGKVSGVTITPSAGGAGGGTKIILRGNKSILGSSTPLIVVDGVPMTNNIRGQINDAATMTYQGVTEGSDPLSMINPDDIESMNVLKGANAAALYGSKAANGVIMITTKKGKEGKLSVNYTGNVTFDTPLLTPEIQRVYGANVDGSGKLGEANGWGDKIANTPAAAYVTNDAKFGGGTRSVNLRNSGKDDVADFFRTGWTTNNSISLSGGTEKVQSYVSFANAHAEGMIETNNYNRNTFAFRQNYNLFNNRLHIEASLNYVQTKTKNRTGGGTALNPIYHLYTMPGNVDLDYYKDNYVIDNGQWLSDNQSILLPFGTGYTLKTDSMMSLSGPMQNWAYMDARQNNPYWLLKQNTSVNNEDRVYGGFTGTIDIWDGLSFRARVNIDHTKYRSESKRYATTWLPASMENYGRYWKSNSNTTELYTDFLLSYNKTFAEDWSVSASAGWVGHTIQSNNTSTDVVATYVDGSRMTLSDRVNLFTTSAGGNGATGSSSSSNWDKAALFTGQVGWQEKIYVDFSYRQDWYRAFRQFKDRGVKDNYGYFGVGANAILSDLVRLPKFWTYAKLRVSYSEVGNSIPNTVYAKGSENLRTGAITSTIWSTFRNPVPEKTNSFEAGFETLFLDNNLNFDFTFYNSIMKNLYMIGVNASGKSEPVNSGKIRNRGFETTLGYNFILTSNLRWKTAVNFSYNDNKILETTYNEDGSEKLIYTDIAGVRVRYTKGGSVGDMYIRDLFHNPDGTLFQSASGRLLKERRYTKKIGNMNSKYQLGWSNTISYKDFQLFFLINGRIGGKVISLTEAYLDELGLSQRSADARLESEKLGLFMPDGTPAMYLPDGSGNLIGIRDYYQFVGQNAAPYAPNYVYDATNFRLRELSLGYTFRDLFGEGKSLSLSFIARNLFFIYKDAPCDPDISLSTGNGLGGFELFNMPSSRSFGFNVKLTL